MLAQSSAWGIVERDIAVDAIVESALANRVVNHGSVLCGPPGSGKTVLLQQIADRYHATILHGAFQRGVRATPEPAPAAHSTPKANVFRLHSSNNDQPCILCVDNARAIDLRVAADILIEARRSNAAIIATIRTDDINGMIEQCHPFRYLQPFDLAPMSEHEVGQLCSMRLAGPLDCLTQRRITDLCGGHPLFTQRLVEVNVRAGLLREQRGYFTAQRLIVPASALDPFENRLRTTHHQDLHNLLTTTKGVTLTSAQFAGGKKAMAAKLRNGQLHLISTVDPPELVVSSIDPDRQLPAVAGLRRAAQLAEMPDTADGYALLLPDTAGVPESGHLANALAAARHGDLGALLAFATEDLANMSSVTDSGGACCSKLRPGAGHGQVIAAIRKLTTPPAAAWTPAYGIALARCYLASDQAAAALQESLKVRLHGLRHRRPKEIAWGTYLQGAAEMATLPSQAHAKFVEAS